MPLESSSSGMRPPAADEPSRDDVVGVSLCVLVVGSQISEHSRLSKLIGATPETCVYENGHCCETSDRAVTGPDIVLLELDTGNPNSEHMLREAQEAWTPAPVLVLSESSDQEVHCELVRIGARGVLAKKRESDYLITAIRKVSNGEIWLPRRCLSTIIDEMSAAAHVRPRPNGAFGRLTEREFEVATLIADGLDNRAIAEKLGITHTTVRHHLTAIFFKVGVKDRLELAVYSLRRQLRLHGG